MQGTIVTVTQRMTPEMAPEFGETSHLTLALTAEERTRSRQRFLTETGQTVFLQLPRGTVLRDGDWLRSTTENTELDPPGNSPEANPVVLVRVVAKLEPVLTVQASPLELLRAAYHLGNRHVPLEITPTYLRLAPDPVLRSMLEQRGLQVIEEMQPFQPEMGAYGHGH